MRKMNETKTILVTGATSGFGRSIAEIFAENGWNVILTGRRNDRLEEITAAIERDLGVKALPLQFDIRDRNEVANAIASIPEE